MQGIARRHAAGGVNVLFAIMWAVALSACNQNANGELSAAQPHGATIAFESIDGPPAPQFQTLVKNLNDEAHSRNLAVLPRNSSPAYRVRGYLAAQVLQKQTTISWVWDVFDHEEQRAFRINGAESVSSHSPDAWNAADEAVLRRIARASIERLAAFLTSPEVAPGTPAPSAEPQITSMSASAYLPEQSDSFSAFPSSRP